MKNKKSYSRVEIIQSNGVYPIIVNNDSNNFYNLFHKNFYRDSYKKKNYYFAKIHRVGHEIFLFTNYICERNNFDETNREVLQIDCVSLSLIRCETADIAIRISNQIEKGMNDFLANNPDYALLRDWRHCSFSFFFDYSAFKEKGNGL